MSKILVLITSVIKPSSNPLSYSIVRSVYSSEQRLQQTMNTFKSIRDLLPQADIMVCECSPLTPEEIKIFEENTDYFINLYGTKYEAGTCSYSKAAGEGAQTIATAETIFQTGMNEQYSAIIKISGRYWFNECFQSTIWGSDEYPNIANTPSAGANETTSTVAYKLSMENFQQFANYLKTHTAEIEACVAFETLFHRFFHSLPCNTKYFISSLCVCGFCAVDGTFYKN